MTMYDSNPPEQRPKSAGRIATLITAIALFGSGIGIGWLFTEPVQDESSVPEEVPAAFVESTTTIFLVECGIWSTLSRCLPKSPSLIPRSLAVSPAIPDSFK